MAVPPQPRAGVLAKGLSRGRSGPRRAVTETGREDCLEALDRLEEEARLGRKYLQELRREVVRLSALAQKDARPERMARIVEKLEEDELLELRAQYGERARARYPIQVQLTYRDEAEGEAPEDRAFLI